MSIFILLNHSFDSLIIEKSSLSHVPNIRAGRCLDLIQNERSQSILYIVFHKSICLTYKLIYSLTLHKDV